MKSLGVIEHMSEAKGIGDKYYRVGGRCYRIMERDIQRGYYIPFRFMNTWEKRKTGFVVSVLDIDSGDSACAE